MLDIMISWKCENSTVSCTFIGSTVNLLLFTFLMTYFFVKVRNDNVNYTAEENQSCFDRVTLPCFESYVLLYCLSMISEMFVIKAFMSLTTSVFPCSGTMRKINNREILCNLTFNLRQFPLYINNTTY